MNVATITLLMTRKTRRGAFRGLMAGIALRSLTLPGHLLRIHMLFVRESLYPELTHLGRETYSRTLGVNRRFVAYDAHLTRGIRKVLCMTFSARRVAGEHGSDAIVQTLMAEGAILGLSLVLGTSMIEG